MMVENSHHWHKDMNNLIIVQKDQNWRQMGSDCSRVQGFFLGWWNVLELDSGDGRMALKIY